MRLGGDPVGRHGAARHLNHRSNEVLDANATLLHHRLGNAIDDRLLVAQLPHVPDEGDHDFGRDPDAFLRELAGRLDNRPRLHLGDFRVRDAEPNAPMA